MFLPFGSRKEFLRFYGAADTAKALREWASQRHLSPGDAATRLLRDPGAVALFGREAILGMRPRTRMTPYGYRRKKGALVPDPEEAFAVADFFRLYQDGMSLRQIADLANQQSIPTSRGGRWGASTIRHILRNPIYVGRLRRGVIVREGGPPGLIHPKLFEAVQNGLTRRAKRARGTIREGPSGPPV
ncbi:MAG: recombinase family protein [Thermoplasmata archaeon]